MTKLYNLKSTLTGFAIVSFDEDFNLLAAYSLTPVTKGHGYTCDCPANNRTVITSLCRHRKMLPLLMGAVNTNRFYNHDTGGWVELGEGASEASGGDVTGEILDTIDPSWGIDNSGPTECRDESTSSLLTIQQYDAEVDEVKEITPKQLLAQTSPSTLRRR